MPVVVCCGTGFGTAEVLTMDAAAPLPDPGGLRIMGTNINLRGRLDSVGLAPAFGRINPGVAVAGISGIPAKPKKPRALDNFAALLRQSFILTGI
jgi:hypothetical protein